MDAKDIKEIKKLIALCRKEGVEELEIGGTRIVLGARPAPVRNPAMSRKKGAAQATGDVQENGEVPTDGEKPPSGDELLFWSAQAGLPFTIETMPGGGGGDNEQ